MRNVLAVICILCVLLSGCAAQPSAQATGADARQVLVVGIDNYPPYSYEDANGQPVGIDIELATEAFHRMGYEPEFQYINWESKKEMVESGEIDCIWSSFSINGREEQYRWTAPYMVSRQVVAVREDSDIQTLADLAGKRIAVQSTTKPEEIFTFGEDPRIPEVQEIFSLQKRELLYPYLSKGYADAIAAHETAILQCMKDYGLEYRILDEPLMKVGLGVAFARDDTRGLERQLSEMFAEMRTDGTMEEILGRYLEHPEHYLEVDAYADE